MISNKASLLVRFSLNQVTGPLTNPDQTAINPSFGVQFFDHQRNFGVKYSRAVTSHFISDTSLSYIRSTPFFPTTNHTQPGIDFGDGLFQSFNAPAGSIFGSYSNLYQFKEDMAWVHGTHAFKWGVEIRVNRDSTIFGTNPNGAYEFGGGTAYSPYLIKSASGTHDIQPGDPLPDSLTGLLTATPFSYSITVPASITPVGDKFDEAGVRREAYNFYFLDAWKASAKLTVNYGLRYEVNSRIHEATKRTSLPVFLGADGKPTSYGDPNATQVMLINPQPPYNQDWNGWGPRLGIDYALRPHTVLHAGGAITTLLPNLWQDNFLTAGIPFVFAPYITALPGVSVPFQNTFVPVNLPTAYNVQGQPIFATGNSADVPANTEMDMPRFQKRSDCAYARQSGAVAHDRRDRQEFWQRVHRQLDGGSGSRLPRCKGECFVRGDHGNSSGEGLQSQQLQRGGSRARAVYGVQLGRASHRRLWPGSPDHAVDRTPPITRCRPALPRIQRGPGWACRRATRTGKSLDDTSSVLGGLFGSSGTILQTAPQDPWNPSAEKGPSTFDVTHVFSASVIQLLPLDRLGFLKPLGKTLTRGWQFLNITTLTTGSPFSVYSGIQQTGAGAGGTDRPDQVGTPHFSTSRPVRDDYFGLGADNPSFFSIPINVPGGTGPNQGRFGTLGRNTFRGPGYHDFDFALIKDTPFGHRGGAELGTLEFRAEFFNIFNIVNFGLPSNILRGSGFGVISKTAGTSRQIQFSLKIIY